MLLDQHSLQFHTFQHIFCLLPPITVHLSYYIINIANHKLVYICFSWENICNICKWHACSLLNGMIHKKEQIWMRSVWKCDLPMRGTESDVAGMISATRSMKTVSDSSTVMPGDADREGEYDQIHNDTIKVPAVWNPSSYPPVNAIGQRPYDRNHSSAAACWRALSR